MHSLTAILLSFIASLPATFAAGSAHVFNNCGTDVYYASVSQGGGGAMKLLPAGGYSEPYKANVGVSIKLSPSPNGAVTQFEFTLASPNINYDISNIDGNPFAKQGTSLVPSMAGAAGFPTCKTVSCPAGQANCDAAYNLPDDVRTMVCPENSDLTFTLCPGGAPVELAASQSTQQDDSVPKAPAKQASTPKNQSAVPAPSAATKVNSASPSKTAQAKEQSATAYHRYTGNRQHAQKRNVHHF